MPCPRSRCASSTSTCRRASAATGSAATLTAPSCSTRCRCPSRSASSRSSTACAGCRKRRIADPALRAEVRDFIGQEASHRFVHEQYNAAAGRAGPGVCARSEHQAPHPLPGAARPARLAGRHLRDRALHGDAGRRRARRCQPGSTAPSRTCTRCGAGTRSRRANTRAWRWTSTAPPAAATGAGCSGTCRPASCWCSISLIQTTDNLRREGQLWKARTWISAAPHLAGPRRHLLAPAVAGAALLRAVVPSVAARQPPAGRALARRARATPSAPAAQQAASR